MCPADLEPLALIAAEVAADWGLELGPPFALSRYSYVAPAGEDAVLKVTPPEDDESDEEADALALWGGDGAVRLLRRDRERRALLIERARPGERHRGASRGRGDRNRRRPRRSGCGGRRRSRSAGSATTFPRWLDQAERSDQEGRDLIPFARELYASLAVGRETLVHGDFHHHNILRAGDRYLAIDAKAMLGEPEFDVASFLWNPLGSTMRLDVTERRLAAFAGGRSRPGADARVGRDPRRLPRIGRERGTGAARHSLGESRRRAPVAPGFSGDRLQPVVRAPPGD